MLSIEFSEELPEKSLFDPIYEVCIIKNDNILLSKGSYKIKEYVLEIKDEDLYENVVRAFMDAIIKIKDINLAIEAIKEFEKMDKKSSQYMKNTILYHESKTNK